MNCSLDEIVREAQVRGRASQSRAGAGRQSRAPVPAKGVSRLAIHSSPPPLHPGLAADDAPAEPPQPAAALLLLCAQGAPVDGDAIRAGRIRPQHHALCVPRRAPLLLLLVLVALPMLLVVVALPVLLVLVPAQIRLCWRPAAIAEVPGHVLPAAAAVACCCCCCCCCWMPCWHVTRSCLPLMPARLHCCPACFARRAWRSR